MGNIITLILSYPCCVFVCQGLNLNIGGSRRNTYGSLLNCGNSFNHYPALFLRILLFSFLVPCLPSTMRSHVPIEITFTPFPVVVMAVD